MSKFPKPHVVDLRQMVVAAIILLLCGTASVLLFPTLDHMTGSVQPTLLSIVGPAVSISLITIGVLFWLADGKVSYTKRLMIFLTLFSFLMIFVKFTLSPSILFVAGESFNFDGQFADMWSSPGIVLAAIIFGVFLLYVVVFSILRYGFSKRLGIKETKSKIPKVKKVHTAGSRFITILILVGLAVFSGGGILLLPLAFIFFGVSSVDPVMQYLSFVFGGATGIMAAVCLASAAGFLALTFDEAVKISITRRDIALFVSVVWVAIGLLVIYHILWAVYMFVLVTFWPFKVTTVVPK